MISYRKYTNSNKIPSKHKLYINRVSVSLENIVSCTSPSRLFFETFERLLLYQCVYSANINILHVRLFALSRKKKKKMFDLSFRIYIHGINIRILRYKLCECFKRILVVRIRLKTVMFELKTKLK